MLRRRMQPWPWPSWKRRRACRIWPPRLCRQRQKYSSSTEPPNASAAELTTAKTVLRVGNQVGSPLVGVGAFHQVFGHNVLSYPSPPDGLPTTWAASFIPFTASSGGISTVVLSLVTPPRDLTPINGLGNGDVVGELQDYYDVVVPKCENRWLPPCRRTSLRACFMAVPPGPGLAVSLCKASCEYDAWTI